VPGVHPPHSSRYITVAFAQGVAGRGQNASQPQPSPSRIDLFAGYSYWQANGSAGGVSFSNANLGVLISGAYYLDRNIGVELAGDYHFTGGNDSMRSLSIGPIVRGQPYHGFTPFVHALAGATNMLGPGAFYDNHDAPQSATWGGSLRWGPAWITRCNISTITLVCACSRRTTSLSMLTSALVGWLTLILADSALVSSGDQVRCLLLRRLR
jgi:hypothetical protein